MKIKIRKKSLLLEEVSNLNPLKTKEEIKKHILGKAEPVFREIHKMYMDFGGVEREAFKKSDFSDDFSLDSDFFGSKENYGEFSQKIKERIAQIEKMKKDFYDLNFMPLVTPELRDYVHNVQNWVMDKIDKDLQDKKLMLYHRN